MPPPPSRFLAHFDAIGRREHLLDEHLRDVGKKAAEFAHVFGSADWARLAGLWHDLGKYRTAFQDMICRANGEEAHIEDDRVRGRVDHSSPGAVYAHQQLGSTGLPLALIIAGHHTGLKNKTDWDGGPDSRFTRTKGLLAEINLPSLPQYISSVPSLTAPKFLQDAPPVSRKLRLEFWIRMLFSCLVDADFLDTERFYNQAQSDSRGAYPTLMELAARLRRYMDSFVSGASPSAVNTLRREVLDQAREKAVDPPGVFSLTVPTGGGKTLASLTFALEHAICNELRRVIVAAPYLTIIDQTVTAYAGALGDGGDMPFIEHHSGVDPERETSRNRLATENWDVPLVVTTQVQLLESLFARRTSHCRKLHNLTRAVIVLDEIQTLPAAFRTPVLDALRTLVEDYGATLVLSSATQPDLLQREAPDGRVVAGFSSITEIAGAREQVQAHFRAMRRVAVDHADTSTWDEVAALVTAAPRALAITHQRRDARDLAQQVRALRPDEPLFHLSALMCARHRQARLAEIRMALAGQGPVRVVSTQLVEAGVDLDFPVVFRAMAGFDALIQSAGRCNREGKLAQGRLVIFRAPTQPPRGWLRTAADQATAEFRGTPDLDLFDPETYRRFDRKLINAVGGTDKHGIQNARQELAYETVADKFRLIDKAGMATVIVPWGLAPQLLEEAANTNNPAHLRFLARRLQGFSVEIPRRQADAWVQHAVLHSVADLFLTLSPPYRHLYDEELGLDAFEAAPGADPAALIG